MILNTSEAHYIMSFLLAVIRNCHSKQYQAYYRDVLTILFVIERLICINLI